MRPKGLERLTLVLYTLLVWMYLPFALIHLLVKSRQNPEYRSRFRERLGLHLPRLEGCIHVHAVSVGETVAAQPLIEQLLHAYPHREILITSTTPTGAARVQALFGQRVVHRYLPFDTGLFMARFIKIVQPGMIIIIETEIWPQLLYQAHRRQTPVILANARLSERSMKGYKRLHRLTQQTLQRFTRIAAHAPNDAARFIELGAIKENVTMTGSLKFDLEIPQTLEYQAAAYKKHLGDGRFIWVAASTHDGEEKQLLHAAKAFKKTCPKALFLLVPRHAERFEAVHKLMEEESIAFVRFSQETEITDDIDAILCDTMGQLLLFYTLADTAFVGGSLVPVGGHNILEPLACKTPTIVGPHMFNFQSIHDLLKESKAIIEIQSIEELVFNLDRLAKNKHLKDRLSQRGFEVVQNNKGALSRLLVEINRILPNR